MLPRAKMDPKVFSKTTVARRALAVVVASPPKSNCCLKRGADACLLVIDQKERQLAHRSWCCRAYDFDRHSMDRIVRNDNADVPAVVELGSFPLAHTRE